MVQLRTAFSEGGRNVKKAFILILAILLTITQYGGSVTEEKQTEYRSGDYSFVLLADGTAGIADYTGKASSLAIPDKLDGHTVMSIVDGAFAYCISLVDVTIPDSVISIEDGAFEGCTGLTGAAIPDSVTSIGNGAFFMCESLAVLAIPDSVMSIGTEAFGFCSKLTLTVGRSSYAEGYAIQHDIAYTYPSSGLNGRDGTQPLTVTRDPVPPVLRMTNNASALALRQYICARLKTEAFIAADFTAMMREEAASMANELAELWETAIQLANGAEFIAEVAQTALADEASRTAMGGLRNMQLAAHPAQYLVVALANSDYMEWAERISAIYDAHESAGKLKNLAAELGTDARTALERLTMAQQIIRDGALADAEYYNSMTNIARGVKTGCAVTLFAASTVVSGGGSLIALAGSTMTVAEGGAFIVGGVSCLVDVASTGSTIILGEDNQVTASADNVQKYLGPISYTIGLATFHTAELGDQIAYFGDSVLDAWIDGKILGVEVIPDSSGSWMIEAQAADALGLNQHETATLIRDMGFVPPEEQDTTLEELLGDYTMNAEEALAEMGTLIAAAMNVAADADTDPYAVPDGQSPDVQANHSGVPTLDEMVGTYDGETSASDGSAQYPTMFVITKTDGVTGFMRFLNTATGEPLDIGYPFTYSDGILTMQYPSDAKPEGTSVAYGADGRVTISWSYRGYWLRKKGIDYFDYVTTVYGVRRDDHIIQ